MNSQQEANRRYYEKNKERRSFLRKKWKNENRTKFREINSSSQKRQLARNPAFKARHAWRGRIWRVFVRGAQGPDTISVLGCSAEQFREHIYSQLHSGMTKENYAELWELDHIEPCYKFDCTNEEQLRACFHYTNYRPRLKVENQWNPNKKHEKTNQ